MDEAYRAVTGAQMSGLARKVLEICIESGLPNWAVLAALAEAQYGLRLAISAAAGESE